MKSRNQYIFSAKLKRSVTFLLLLLPGLSNSQPSLPESKEDALRKLQLDLPDSNRQYLCNYLGSVYYADSWPKPELNDSAFFYLRKAVYLGDSINASNNTLTNESLTLLAETYLHTGNVARAKKIFNQVLRLYQANAQTASEASLWRKIGREIWNTEGEFNYALTCLDNAFRLYDIREDIYAKAEVLIDKINFYGGKGMTGEAEKVYRQLLLMSRSSKYAHFSSICQMLAKENRYKGNFNKALEYALQSVQYSAYASDKKMLQGFYGELAQVYQELGEPERSAYWYEKCIREREKLGFPLFVMYRTMSLMVVQLVKDNRAVQALSSLRQMEQKMPPVTHADKASLAQSYAYCYSAQNRNDMAEKKFLEMIAEYSGAQTHKEVLSIAYLDIGKFYVTTGHYEKAAKYLKTSAVYAKNSAALSRQKDLYLLLFKVDSATGNFFSAIQNFRYYKELNDSIFSEVKSQQISDLMIRYETDKKDDNIKFLEKERMMQEGKVIQANQTRNWMLGVAILLLLIIALLVNNARMRQNSNKKLKIQQKEIQAKNNSLQQLVLEKEWLVKEIHHRVKNNFHTVIGLLRTQASYLKSQEAIEAMNESQQRIHTMSLIHQKLYQSENLSAINMSGYMHELVDYLRESFSIRKTIQFYLDIDPVELELSHCLPLGLIMNEAITNAIKYAFPGNKDGTILISLKSMGENQFRLRVQDNGIGLPPTSNSSNTGSMGMNLMQGLSEDIDGKLSILSGNGTTILLDFNHNMETNLL